MSFSHGVSGNPHSFSYEVYESTALNANWNKIIKDNRYLIFPLVLSFLLPLIHLYSSRNSPAFTIPYIDSREYVVTAKHIADSSFSYLETGHLSKLYTWIISAIIFLFGQNLILIKLFQIVVHTITGIILYKTAKELFSSSEALISIYIWSLYGPVIFFDCEIISVSLILFTYLLSFYLLMQAIKKGGSNIWIATGVIFSLATLARADILIFCAVVFFGITFYPKDGEKRNKINFKAAALFLFGFASPLLLLGVKDYISHEEFNLVPAESGLNFYLGNNEEFTKSIGPRPGPYWNDISEMPYIEGGIRDGNEHKRSLFFYKKTLHFIEKHPLRFLEALFFKIRTLINGYELPTTFDIYTSEKYSFVLPFLIWRIGFFSFPFSLILPLACMGIFLIRKKSFEVKWALAMLLSFFPSLIGFWNSDRYRIEAVPILILFSSFAIAQIMRSYFLEERKKIIQILISLSTLIFMLNIPYLHFSKFYNYKAEMFSFTGTEALHNDRKIKRGIKLLETSIELLKDNREDCDNGWGGKAVKSECEAILHEYNHALAAMSYTNLGDAMLYQGEYEKAEMDYSKAIKAEPNYMLAYNNMGSAFAREGKPDKAIEYFLQAIRLRPDYPIAHTNLAAIFLEKGRLKEAAIEFAKVVKLKPNDSTAYYNLAYAFEKMGDREKATKFYLKALKRPGNKDRSQQRNFTY